MKRLIVCLAVLLMSTGCAEAEESAESDSADSTVSALVFHDEDLDCSGRGISYIHTTALISKAGTYTVSGVCDDAKIIVDTEDSGMVTILLNGTDLSCQEGPVISVFNAGQAVITVQEETENSLRSAGKDEDGEKAAVFSEEDLLINGRGTLYIASEDSEAVTVNGELTVRETDLRTHDEQMPHSADAQRP